MKNRRSLILFAVAAACIGSLAWGEVVNQNTYTVPAIEDLSLGTLSGLAQAYQTLDEGMSDPNVTGDRRQLILLHAATRAGMLVFDMSNVAVDTSLLEVVQPFGIGITGNKFFSADPCDPDLIQLVLPTDPNDPNCLVIPPGADVNAAAAAINGHILPELQSIIDELNTMTNSPAFIMMLRAADTGLPTDVEVDWGDVLALKTWLLSARTFLYAVVNPAGDFQIDLTNPIFAGWQCRILPDTTTIHTILNTYPNLFEVLPGTGPARLTQTKTYLLAALDSAIAMLDSLLAETDDQSNDLLMMEAEDRPGNVIVRAEMAKFRGSLATGTAATYTLGSRQEFSLRQGADVVGRVDLTFRQPFNEPEDGWVILSDPIDVPGGWEIDWFDIDGTQIVGNVSAPPGTYWGWFQGTISADGSQITNMTFDWWTFNDSGTVTGLSAVRTFNQPMNLRFNPGPIFAGTVSLRDALPQLDPNGEPIPGTMGHGINNDATVGGIFPAMTQLDWISYGFEVWGGNTDYRNINSAPANDAPWWEIFQLQNISRYGYTRLGSSNGANLTVSGNYQFYAIVAKGKTFVDSIRGSTGAYYSGPVTTETQNVETPENMTGAPDGQFAKVGQTNFLPDTPSSGFVVLPNPGNWTGLTVITGGAEILVTATVSPSQVAANGTSVSTITITVKDSLGAPIANVPAADIVVSASGTGHTITQPQAGTVTNANGQITATIRSTVADPSKRIHVTVNGAPFNEVATVVFAAGTANKLVFIAQPAGPYVAGAAINAIPQVAVQDAQGNTITTSVAQITMAIGTNPGSGTLSGTKQRTAIAGLASFSGLSINKAGVGYTLRATSPGLIAAESNPFNIIANASEARLVFATQPDDSPALGALVGPPQVAVQDAAGNTVTTVNPAVTLTIKAGTGADGATLSGTNPVTAVGGVATFNDLKINRAGIDFQLRATGTGVDGSVDSQKFDITAQPAMTIEKEGPEEPVDPGDDVTYVVTYGNEGLADGQSVVIRETLPAGMAFVSATNGGALSGNVITWNIGTVPADTNGLTVSFVAHVTDALGDGGIVTNSNLTITAGSMQPVGQITPETTTVRDRKAPQVSGQIPDPNSISAPLDAMIRLHVTDEGSGVKYNGGTVKIYVEDDLIYDGSAETSLGVFDSSQLDQAVRGITRRTGDPNDYAFTFLPTMRFRYEQEVNVRVDVADVSGNADTVNYSFFTQMRTFGTNSKVNSDPGTAIQDNPAVATDPDGNIWVVWDQRASSTTQADIYLSKLLAGGDAFGPSLLIYNNSKNQANPAIAADSTGRLYVAWEQWNPPDPNRYIMLASSADGVTWVSDPNSPPSRVNPVPAEPKTAVAARNPSMVVSQADQVYIAWEETRNSGNSDIWLRSFTHQGGFAAATQITTNTANQTEPFVGTDPNGVVYVVWTDARNAATTGTDIFGARADIGPWTEASLVATDPNQNHAVGATANQGHLAWVDDNDLRYAYRGITAPVSVLDPGESDILPALPALAAAATDANDRVYVSWVDSRDVALRGSDIYFAEAASPFGTNIRVNDDTGASRQTKPAIGILPPRDPNDANAVGDPYLVWVDNRGGNDDIYFAGSMVLDQSQAVVAGPNRVTVPVIPNLEVTIPEDALPAGIEISDITIAEVENPPKPPAGGFGLAYSFGPNGTQFASPVTVRIPIDPDTPTYSTYNIYWYDPATLAWILVGDATRHTNAEGTYLEFQVSHFTTFTAVGITGGGGGGGGGGCALSPWSNTSPVEFALPFALCILILLAGSVLGGLRRRSGGAKD